MNYIIFFQANDFEEKREHRNFVETFFNLLPPEPNEVGEFIHVDAIMNLSNFEVKPLDNSPLICPHNGLDVKKVCRELSFLNLTINIFFSSKITNWYHLKLLIYTLTDSVADHAFHIPNFVTIVLQSAV